MDKPINPGNYPQMSLNACNDISPVEEPLNEDKIPGLCRCEGDSLNAADQPDLGWLTDACEELGRETGGTSGLCDPMQTGSIVNDLRNPDRNTIYRYAKGIRHADMAMKDMFSNLVVLDTNGKAFGVPIIYGSQERAVAAIMFDNVRKDNSLVVDRIRLPLLSIYQSGIQYSQDRYTYHKAVDYLRRLRPDRAPGFTASEFKERDTVFGVTRGIPIDVEYTLSAWALYIEDMNQIVEQVITKFSPIAYIRVRGVQWEIGVKLTSIANNLEAEPGDQKLRVIKFQFNLTAETYIPQPIIRQKAVLTQQIDMSAMAEMNEITEALDRLEIAIKESDK